MKNIKLGAAGDHGSFSEQAGLEYINKAQLVKDEVQLIPLIDVRHVMLALDHNEIDMGIVPIINSNSGLVFPAFDELGQYNFCVIDTIYLAVKQCLLARSVVKLEQIEKIYSYDPAFKQCKIFLKKYLPKATLIDYGDTAKAARDLSNGILSNDRAVIGSERLAKLYNLQILAENIQDDQQNITTFIVVMKRQNDLHNLRQQIDNVDGQLIKLIYERQKIIQEIAQYKLKNNLTVVDKAREIYLHAYHQKLGEEFGLNKDFVEQLFELIIDQSRTIQNNKLSAK